MKTIHTGLLLLAMTCAAGAQDPGRDAPLYVQAWGHERKGEYDLAFDAYRKSFEAGEKINARSPEQKAFDLATKRLNRFEEGVQVLQQAIERAPRAEHHFDLAEFYYNRVKEYGNCRPHYQKAYELYLKENNYRYASRCLRVMAKSYGHEMKSMDYYDWIKVRKRYPGIVLDLNLKALALNDKVPPNWRDHERAHALEEIAGVYDNKWFEGHDPAKALEYLRQAHEAGSRTDKVSDNSVKRDGVKQLLDQRKYPEAIALAEECLAETPNSPWLWSQISKAHEAMGQYELALAANDKALEWLDHDWSKLKTDREKLAAHRQRFGGYAERGVTLALKAQRHDRAFENMETVKARALLDLLQLKETTGRDEMMGSHAREQEALLEEVDAVQKQIEQERKLGHTEQVASLQRSLVLIEDKAQVLKARTDANRRELLSTASAKPLTCAETQAMLEDFTLIQYVHPHEVAVVTKDSVHVRYVNGSTKLPKLHKQYLEALQAESTVTRGLELETPSGSKPAATQESLHAARAMYDICIRPIEEHIKTELVYILPDGWYNPIPFQALHDGRKFFVEKHSVAYAPSASVLKKCMEKRRPFRGNIVALGNPNLMNPKYRLAYAEQEVRALSGLYTNARVLTGNAASEKAVQALAPDAGVLHFACHGEIDFDEPIHSNLRLSPDDENDGFLHAYEIFNLGVKASLVTLSACESGLGKNRRENEVLGLPRAWLFAGAPSVVASLWKVDDRATARLMIEFYRNLQTEKKADALRAAQLTMIRDGYSPFYWGAFCLYGDYQ